ncbi:phosphatase PAP2 family protein [Thalassolituus sp.]|jgi:lipid A 4'-phosphatase|uniref:phosphatase PAP2 family protein n=1 Tax=Thalassolituus sp. TaxID=2030822 RepID=UPI00260E01BA|nr:phosphatase PAP2 family protein [uncultured Thalassolituus sp.]TNC91337.1 MAG: hypothetical protein CSH36_10180 [Thalassolituus sp.]
MKSFVVRHADWLSFIVLSIIFVAFPAVDLTVSGWFYNPTTDTWWGASSPVADSIYGLFRYLPFLLVPVMLAVVLLGLKKGMMDKSLHRIWVFLLVSLLAGPGILVHSVAKEGFDRARPKNVEQFGGRKEFTRAYEISSSCDKGCNSFVSGHAAMGFWFMALGWALGSRGWFWAGVVTGLVLSATRIIQGGHFLSDTLLAGYLCYFTLRICAWKILRHSRISV